MNICRAAMPGGTLVADLPPKCKFASCKVPPMSAYRSKGGTLVSLTEVRETVERQQLLFPDDATVRSYADRMQKGDEFEPVKVIKRQDGCYDLKDGHHRF